MKLDYTECLIQVNWSESNLYDDFECNGNLCEVKVDFTDNCAYPILEIFQQKSNIFFSSNNGIKKLFIK